LDFNILKYNNKLYGQACLYSHQNRIAGVMVSVLASSGVAGLFLPFI
jgi:hypothetical protein